MFLTPITKDKLLNTVKQFPDLMYRPISILSLFSKILEKLFCNRFAIDSWKVVIYYLPLNMALEGTYPLYMLYII